MKVQKMNGLKEDIIENYKLFKKSKTYAYLRSIFFLRAIVRIYYKLFSRTFRLHGDPILQKAFVLIGKEMKATSIVETGTFLGSSTSFMAEGFKDIPIYTCEVNDVSYKKAKKKLRNFVNVNIYKETSPKFLNYLVDNDMLGERPLFFLDAHWLDDWPLEEEIKIISERLKAAVVIIDDFKIEGDERFKFDEFNGKVCSVEMIKSKMSKKMKYNLLFPNYGNEVFKSRSHPELTGYPIIFQGIREFFNKITGNEFIKNYFVDRSSLLNMKK